MTPMDQIEKSAAVIKKHRPVYQPILAFYTRVFQAQERCRQAMDLPPVEMDEKLLTVKQENQMPLIDPSEFYIDGATAVPLLAEICALAQDMAPELSQSAVAIKKALGVPSFDVEALARALLARNHAVLEEEAENLGVPVADLTFLIHAAVVPAIQVRAEQLAVLLDRVPGWGKPYCPVCGTRPDLAFFDEEGRRHVKCALCSHQWTIARMGCVFCENRDRERQFYFYSDAEKEYRVNLCDHCGRYIKLVDLRQMDRPFVPHLEMVASLHLDFKAREKGYVDGQSPGPSHPTG